MAVELCSENCDVSSTSPRISFSHDISQTDVIPVEQHPFESNSSGLNSTIEFDFCVSESFELESSSADELFSDGRILPTEVKKKNAPLKKTVQLAPQLPILPPSYATCNINASSTSKNLKKENHKESKYLNDEVCDKQSSSKSFWSFKRSSSCGSVYGRSLCPFPLLLSRSNSTGSNTSVKRSPMSKEGTTNIKKNSQKHSPSRFSPSMANNYQRPPLNNKSHGSYGNSVRVSPVLNVPSANLFGLASIFSSNRYKSKK